MMSGYAYAFIDASGDPGLDTSATGRYYVISCVLVNDSEISGLRTSCEALRRTHFQTGEMKSSTIANKVARREKILKDLSVYNFSLYIIAIDKEKINFETGLQYKRTFIKYCYRKLFEVIFKYYEGIDVVLDNLGGPEYNESFVQYINDSYNNTLFDHAKLSLRDSKEEVLLQLADFMAGSFNKFLQGSAEDKNKIIVPIKSKILSIETWPVKWRQELPRTAIIVENEDELISNKALEIIESFIEDNAEASDQQVQIQIYILNYLKNVFAFESPRLYTNTKKLIGLVKNKFGIEYDPRKMRRECIANLRDSGILLASGKKGYKVPSGLGDLYSYIDVDIKGSAL